MSNACKNQADENSNNRVLDTCVHCASGSCKWGWREVLTGEQQNSAPRSGSRTPKVEAVMRTNRLQVWRNYWVFLLLRESINILQNISQFLNVGLNLGEKVLSQTVKIGLQTGCGLGTFVMELIFLSVCWGAAPHQPNVLRFEVVFIQNVLHHDWPRQFSFLSAVFTLLQYLFYYHRFKYLSYTALD